MSKQMPVILGVLAATFLVGVGIGYMLSSDPAHSYVPAKATSSSSTPGFFTDSAAQDREQSNTLLSNRIRELEKELGEAKTDQRAILADRLTFFKKFHDRISLQPFGPDLKVTPEMVALLNLTPEEQKAIEQHLEEAKAELDKLQDESTVLSKQTDNSVSYEIAADKEKGDALKDQLHSLLAGDMGDDRADVFMGTNSYDYNMQLDRFMESKKQIEISWTAPGPNNLRTFTVRQNFFNADGSQGGSSSSSGGGLVQPEFQKYLPEGIKP